MKKAKQFFTNKQTIVGLIILAVLVFMAIFAPVLAPGNPLFSVGAPIQKPNSEFIFGTDNMGRDVFAMIVLGSRVSMLFAFGAAGLSLIIGVVLGALLLAALTLIFNDTVIPKITTAIEDLFK